MRLLAKLALLLACLLVIPSIVSGATAKRGPRGVVEEQVTDGAAGTSPVSDGASGLTMTDVATQAELDAVAVWPDSFQGEVAAYIDLVAGATAADLAGGADFYMIPNVWGTERLDLLGQWQPRSQGEDADGGTSISMDWRVDSLVCWEPPYTHLMWLQKHCSGHATLIHTNYSAGRLCTIAGDCQDGGETCDAVTFDWSTAPDTFTVTGHGFGATDAVFARPMGLERGHNSPPVSGYDAGAGNPRDYPSGCGMIDGNSYWLKVTGANTFNLYLDDGDCAEEISGDDSTALNCTSNGGDWQALTLYAKESDCSDPVRYFNVGLTQNVIAKDDTAPTGSLYIGMQIAQDRFEGVEENDVIGSAIYTKATEDDEYVGTLSYETVAMSPGECLSAIGYVWGLGGFEDLGPGFASMSITEARRSSPRRAECAYTANDTVSVPCMNHSVISNRGAAGNVTLTLSSFAAEMDFCVVNEASGDHTLNIDPAGTERFTAPATNADGDSMQSVLQGETLCAIVLSDGDARVTHNTGGWTDAD